MNAFFLWLRTHLLHFFVIILALLVIIAGGIGLFLVAQTFDDAPQTPAVTNGKVPGKKNPPVTPPETPSDQPASALPVRIIFAGDLATNGGCADHGASDACDLFTADLDVATGAISNVAQQTSTDLSESYPAWHPNGERAYFTTLVDAKHKDLGSVDLATKTTALIQTDATWAEVNPAGNTFLYVSEETDKIMTASLNSEGTILANATPLTNIAGQQDPAFSADGRYVVFHETSTGVGMAGVFDTQTKTTASYGMQSGHCTIGWTGLVTLCDNVRAGGILGSTYANGALSTPALRIADAKPADLAKYDPAFASCNGASFNYPTFCGSDDHVLVSTSCNIGGSVSFSRLFLIDISSPTPTYFPIGKTIDESFNGPGQSTWTADCLAK